MEKAAQPGIGKASRDHDAAKGAGNSNGAPEAAFSAKTTDALADILRRSVRVAHLFAEKSSVNDSPPTIDPTTIASMLYETFKNLKADPAHLTQEQVKLWSDMALLWQRTMTRGFLNQPMDPVISPGRQDKRFRNEAWADNAYFDYIKQHYLLLSRYFLASIDGAKGVDPKTLRKTKFYSRQLVNALSPTNFVSTNPELLEATIASRGENLVLGLRNLLEDIEHGGGRLKLKLSDASAFQFGENIAISPGKVVYQNDLMQLIQYSPSTSSVYRRPLLIVPPWINKFYILDLKPKNSFIKWCVDQGHTVFLISWVNPGPEFANQGFSDYLLKGPLAAFDAIKQATGEDDVNIIGYCIGGTLTAIALAYMEATGSKRAASTTFFTTLLDFGDVGDISVFIDDAQLELLDQHMDRLGYLEGHHMAEAFNMLRENDLIWSVVVNNYLLGREPPAFDLLYWNSDSTRMPSAMLNFYLRNMYHRNALKDAGGITMLNVPIDLRTIDVPLYFLSAREDHIAPWHSTYLGARLPSGPVRFVLGASGHIAGVVNPPSANKYTYWTNDALPDDPDTWLAHAELHPGSWWTDWSQWIAEFGGEQVPARQPGSGGLSAIEDAPGSYVQVRGA